MPYSTKASLFVNMARKYKKRSKRRRRAKRSRRGTINPVRGIPNAELQYCDVTAANTVAGGAVNTFITLAGAGGYYGGQYFSQNILGQHGQYAGVGGAGGAMAGMYAGSAFGPVGMAVGALLGTLAGSAVTRMLSDKSNSGTSAQAGTRSLANATWHTLAIGFDGNTLRGYVDGKESLTWSSALTTIPNGVALAPFLGARTGATAGNVTTFDYFRVIVER